jgi:IMP dehydrogenase
VVTGHGVPSFTCLLECSAVAKEVGVKIIADGGIKNSGDMAKAIAAGADAVMLGSLLAGTDSAPGERFFRNEVAYKSFRGMASQEVYDEHFGQAKAGIAAEGVATSIKCTGPTVKLIHGLTGGLRSAMSYSNARTLGEFKKNVIWGVQTLSAYIEGTPHVNRGQYAA